MTACEQCHAWTIYWTNVAAIARHEQNTDRLMWAERQRSTALRCEKAAA